MGGGFNRNVNLSALVVGAALTSGAGGLTGALDEFAVYDLSGLTQEQVSAKGASIATNHFAVAKSSSGATYSSVVLADNPILYYNFDEVDGTARQLSPVTLAPVDNSLNDLVSAGGTRVAHAALGTGFNLGHAAEFDGVSYFQTSALDAGGGAIVNAPWGVEFWMQVQGGNGDNRQDYLLNFNNNSPAFIYDFKPNQLEMFAGIRTDNGPVVADTTWHHVFWVFYGDGLTGVADRADAYLDGVAVPNIRDAFTRGLSIGGSLVVGAATPGYNGFQGGLDEVAVYDLSGLGTEAAVAAKVEQLVASHLAASKAEIPSGLSAQLNRGQLVLTWSGAGYVLQSAGTLGTGAAWTDVAGASVSPYTVVAVANAQQFYRLIRR